MILEKLTNEEILTALSDKPFLGLVLSDNGVKMISRDLDVHAVVFALDVAKHSILSSIGLKPGPATEPEISVVA